MTTIMETIKPVLTNIISESRPATTFSVEDYGISPLEGS